MTCEKISLVTLDANTNYNTYTYAPSAYYADHAHWGCHSVSFIRVPGLFFSIPAVSTNVDDDDEFTGECTELLLLLLLLDAASALHTNIWHSYQTGCEFG